MESIEAIDRAIVLWINGLHTAWLDQFMWIISGKLTWIPLYLLLLFLFARSFGWGKAAIFLIIAVIGVTISDQLSVHLFKDVFERYRPSHHSELTNVLHFYDLGNGNFYKGGMYGFVSSHASNFMVVCLFGFLTLRKNYKWIGPVLIISYVLVIFSRIYLGVHYLSDVIVGGLLGAIIAYLLYKLVLVRIANLKGS